MAIRYGKEMQNPRPRASLVRTKVQCLAIYWVSWARALRFMEGAWDHTSDRADSTPNGLRLKVDYAKFDFIIYAKRQVTQRKSHCDGFIELSLHVWFVCDVANIQNPHNIASSLSLSLFLHPTHIIHRVSFHLIPSSSQVTWFHNEMLMMKI